MTPQQSLTSATSIEVQQQNTTQVQVREVVPPNHASRGITVVAHLCVEVLVSSTLSSDSQEGCLIHRAKFQLRSWDPGPRHCVGGEIQARTSQYLSTSYTIEDTEKYIIPKYIPFLTATKTPDILW